jgi:Cu2+-exporting ATPase
MEDHKSHHPENSEHLHDDHTHHRSHQNNQKMNEHASHRHDYKKSSVSADHFNHHNHAGHSSMIGDYRKRFWISLVVTLPILIFSPMIQHFLGIRGLLQFSGENYLLFALSSFVFFLGGLPFLKGIYEELKKASTGDDDFNSFSYNHSLYL